MDHYTRILGTVPLFRHCTDRELSVLQKIGRFSSIRKGQTFDMKKISSFNVILDGVFEIEALGRTDIVYLAPGSFFGNVPFTENRLRGTIRAMVDSSLLLFPVEDLYRFFFISFKCLRGFIRIAERMGFELSGIAGRFTGSVTSVTSVFSMERGSGKTLLASALGIALGEKGRTIILDMSYGGESVFTLFEKKITSPISQKMEDDGSARAMVEDRVERVSDTLDLLNISHGSKVKVQGDILQPLLFVLSQDYRFVVMDVSNDDDDFRDSCFGVSDSIVCLVSQEKRKKEFYPIADAGLRDGQRVYYCLNEFHTKGAGSFSGGFIIDGIGASSKEGDGKAAILSRTGGIGRIRAELEKKRTAAVFESSYLDAAFIGGVLVTLRGRGVSFDLNYSSSLGHIVLALDSVSGGAEEFKKGFLSFFQEDRFNSFLDIGFPDGYLFRQAGISKFAEEFFGKIRIEELQCLLPVMLCDSSDGSRHLLSTGHLADTVAAAFLQYPLFDCREIAGRRLWSGFPEISVRAGDLFRTDTGEIYNISVQNSERLGFSGNRVLPMYGAYIRDFLQPKTSGRISELADRNLRISVSEHEMKGEKFLRIAEESANKLLKDIKKL